MGKFKISNSNEKPASKATTKNNNSQAKFKPQQKSSSTKESKPLNLISKPKDFVRGGSKGLTPLEFKDVNLKAQADVAKDDELFAAPTKKRAFEAPKASQKSKKKTEKPATKTSENIDDKYLPILSAKKLALGTLVLGVIKKVDDLELEIAISHQLTAKCLITGISAPVKAEAERFAELDEEDSENENEFSLQDKFKVGQFLMCSITKVNCKSTPYQLEVSIDPQVVQSRFIKEDLSQGTILQAAVLSYESHGVQLDLGIPDMVGFLPKSEYNQDSVAEEYPIGKVVMTRMLSMDNRVTKVSTKDLAQAIPKDPLSTVASILPGTLVDVLVTGHRPNGITVQFMGFYEGHINWYHLKEDIVSKDHSFSKTYKIGSRLNARIVAVSLSVDEKLISLSIKPHILDLDYNSPFLFTLESGEKVENVTINRVDQYGLACSYSADDNIIPAYVPANHIIDDKIDLKKSDTSSFKASTTHSARIIGSFPFEGLVKLSIKPSVVDTDYYSAKDLKVGQKISGTIKDVLTNGIAVSLSNSLQGFVPRSHISDIQLKNISKRYPKGTKVSARVLSLDPAENKLILTLRKSLVKQDGTIISMYSDAQSGMLATGLIKKLLPNGCVVDFFNSVTGFCHISEMSESKLESLHDTFKIGQPVQCKIISVDTTQRKLAVTFRTNLPISAPSGHHNLNTGALDSFTLGDLVSGQIVKAIADGFIVQVNQTKAFLPLTQLSDTLSLSATDAAALYPISSTIDNLIVIQKTQGKGLLLSKKSLLIEGFKNGNVPVSIESTKVGDLVVGYIHSIYDYGVFVHFLGDFNAFCFLKDLADVPCTSPKSLFTSGQSVLAHVIEIDQENQRAKVSLKLSQVRKSKKLPEFTSLQSFNQSYFAQLNTLNTSSSNSNSNSTKPGTTIIADIVSKHEFGWRVQFDKCNGILTTDHITEFAKSNSKDGQVKCKILNADLNQKSLDLTTKLDTISLPSDLSSKLSKQLEKVMKSKQKISAKLELIKENILVFSLPDYNNIIAFSSPTYFNSTKAIGQLSFGQSYNVFVCSLASNQNDTYQFIVSIDPSYSAKPASVDDILLNNNQFELVNAIDSTLTSKHDLKAGRVTKALITKLKQDHLNASLATNVHASIHITQVFDNYDTVPNPEAPLSSIKIGDTVDCKITGSHLAKTHKSLSITGQSNRTPVYNITINPSHLNQNSSSLTIGQLSEGKEYLGFVHEIKKDHLVVSLSPDLVCKVNQLSISSDFKILSKFSELFKVGMAVQCQVLKIVKSKKLVFSSITKAPVVQGKYPAPLQSMDDIQIGQIVSCKVKHYHGLSWNVQLYDNQSSSHQARIVATNLADQFPQNPKSQLTLNSIIQAYVLNKDADSSSVSLSLRGQHIHPEESSQVSDVLITQSGDLKEGQLIQGYVQQIRDEYALIALGDKVNGRVQRNRVSDELVTDINDFLKVGQLVKAKVTKVDAKNNQANLSLKLSSIDPNSIVKTNRVTFSQLQVGSAHSGIVKKVADFGLFIKLDNSNLVGLCRKQNVADSNISDLTDIYEVNERVKTKVINIDSKNHRFELGCKASLFEEDESEHEQLDSETSEHINDDQEEVESDSDASNSSSDSDISADPVSHTNKSPANPLIAKGGFNWDEDDDMPAKSYHAASDDSDSDSDSDSAQETRPKKKAKKTKTIQDDITGDLATATPQVAADYERLLLGSPNSSFLWINYMALQLQLNEVDKARQLANKALDSINVREEQERFNIWIALLNLELKFGELDQVQSTFNKAIHRVTDAEKLYFQLAKMYSDSNHHNLAQDTFKTMCKKFPDSVKIWQTFGEYYMRQGKKVECREVLKKALTSSVKKHHLDIISKFGQLEFKYGETERGRTIFEGVIASHPNRLDLWNIYLDMEIKNGETDIIRRLFKRAIALKGLSSKKIKFLFKKFLTFEKEYGDEYSIEEVKSMAIQYVEAKEEN